MKSWIPNLLRRLRREPPMLFGYVTYDDADIEVERSGYHYGSYDEAFAQAELLVVHGLRASFDIICCKEVQHAD